MSDRTALRYRDSVLILDVQGISVDTALDFLSTHFVVEDTGETTPVPLAHLTVRPLSGDEEGFESSAGWPELYVRKSASDFFTIPARRAIVEGVDLVECTKTGTRMVFDADARRIQVFLGAEGQLDVVELIRDIVLKDQESRGAIVLHATAAYRPDSTVLITGGKGAGKSTILLELVEHHGYSIMSGDKSLAYEGQDGAITIMGWPDYPHLGYGTIVKYDKLPEIAGIDEYYVPRADHAYSPHGKFAVDPGGFRARFASAPVAVESTPSMVIHPSIGAGDATTLEPVDEKTHRDRLARNIESGFAGKHAGWQSYSTDETGRHSERRERVLDALASLPAWSLEGPGDLATVAGLFDLDRGAS